MLDFFSVPTNVGIPQLLSKLAVRTKKKDFRIVVIPMLFQMTKKNIKKSKVFSLDKFGVVHIIGII